MQRIDISVMIFLKLPLLLGAVMLAMMGGSGVMAATSRPLRCIMYLTGYVQVLVPQPLHS